MGLEITLFLNVRNVSVLLDLIQVDFMNGVLLVRMYSATAYGVIPKEQLILSYFISEHSLKASTTNLSANL